jgi:hypothetical protein
LNDISNGFTRLSNSIASGCFALAVSPGSAIALAQPVVGAQDGIPAILSSLTSTVMVDETAAFDAGYIAELCAAHLCGDQAALRDFYRFAVPDGPPAFQLASVGRNLRTDWYREANSTVSSANGGGNPGNAARLTGSGLVWTSPVITLNLQATQQAFPVDTALRPVMLAR